MTQFQTSTDDITNQVIRSDVEYLIQTF